MLTYAQIQNMVLADAFPEYKRTDSKEWIRNAHRKIWDAGDWVFKSKTASSITVVNGVVTEPADVGDVQALYNANGDTLQHYYDERQFQDRYNTLASPGGQPEAYCVIGTQLLVGPTTTGTLTGWQLLYEKAFPAMNADADPTGLPDGFDMALVYGGKWIGFTLINNPFADDFRILFEDAVGDLKGSYLSGISRTGDQQPAYRPY